MGICGSKESASTPKQSPSVVNNKRAGNDGNVTKKESKVSIDVNSKGKSAIKSETRRLGTKLETVTADEPKGTTIDEEVVSHPHRPANDSHNKNESSSARNLAAKAAELRLQQQNEKSKKGQLGRKLEQERKKQPKQYAIEEYNQKIQKKNVDNIGARKT